MSSSFTQHGDLCVEDRYTRANWAIQAGADLVLELPTVYSLSTAKGFAEGALKTLSMLGEYTLSFGTESDEIEDLNMAAEFMRSESKDVSNLLKGYLSEGYSVANHELSHSTRYAPTYRICSNPPTTFLPSNI